MISGSGQLVQGEAERHRRRRAGRRCRPGDARFEEAPVEVGDLAAVVDDEDPVGRGVKRGGEAARGPRSGRSRPTPATVASCAEITIPSTVGSSSRFTMLSSKGTMPRVVAEETDPGPSPEWCAVAPRSAAAERGVELAAVGRATMPSSGRPSSISGSWPSSRVMTPDTDCDGAVGRHQHDDRARVVHERAEAGLAPAGQLVAPAFGQVAQAQQDDVLAGPADGGADHLDQAPSRGRVDPDLDGRADLLVLDGGERSQRRTRGRRGGPGRGRTGRPSRAASRSKIRSAARFPHTMMPASSTRTMASGRRRNASTIEDGLVGRRRAGLVALLVMGALACRPRVRVG